MRIYKAVYDKLFHWLPVISIILIILLAGAGQATTERYLQAQRSHTVMIEANQRALVLAALKDRIDAYTLAFKERDYTTMYQLSYFKDTHKPTLTEYRLARDPGYSYQISISVRDIELHDDKAVVELEMVLTNPALGTNKTTHTQVWELLNGLWYKIDH